MKIYLHIGTEKTGSSYLQTLCSRNREKLAMSGFYYPEAGKREKDMLEGRISPGNAVDLSRLLELEAWNDVRTWLSYRVDSTKRKGVSKLLLSNEALIKSLSERDTCIRFLKICSDIGCTDVNILLMLRDPVDHALSLFKHRSKFGIVKEIDKWLKSDYDTPKELKSLLSFHGEIPLTIGKYTKDGRLLANRFFKEWLEVKSIEISEHDRVNPSLTLSELILMKHIRQQAPKLVRYYYEQMIKVPVSEKSRDISLKTHYESVVSDYLARYLSIYEKYNDFMPAGEKLNLSIYSKTTNEIIPEITFSEAQLKAWGAFICQNHSIGFYLRVGYERDIRPVLAHIKQKFLS